LSEPALLRAAEEGDAGRIAELWTAAYVTEGGGGRSAPYSENDVFEASGNGRLTVAEQEHSVIGVVALLAPGAPGRAVARADEAELSRLVVAASARGRGTGRALVIHCHQLGQRGQLQRDRALEPPLPGRCAPPLRIARLPAGPRARQRRRERARATRLPSLADRIMATVESLTKRLEGSIVTLEPFGKEHVEGLWEAAQAAEIWTWLAHLDKRETFDLWVELTLKAARSGEEGPFVTRDVRSGAVVGSSRYLNVRPADRVVEIGWTWLNPSAWRSGANVEAKLLMMRHAFEALGCVRVEFKTDARNERSRAALAAIPAQFEGVLRNHMTVPDVGLRDSAYFSVIDSEWPAVQANLERRLARGGRPAADPGRGLSLRYANTVEELAALEPAWNALQAHHSEISPDLGPATPKRSPPDSWRIRRSKYERWLRNPDTFFVVAEAAGKPVGYACVTIGPPYAGWATGDRLAELETLSVLADHRGKGTGAALLDAVWKRLAELGVEDMAITTTVTNVDAQRFYERQGFSQRFAVYYGRSPGRL
jgi:RimJ/RimL family protein N-acetyltransferase